MHPIIGVALKLLCSSGSIVVQQKILSSCSIDISNNFPTPQPLLLWPGKDKGFIYPQERGSNRIYLQPGESIRITCPGTRIAVDAIKANDTFVKCVTGDIFTFDKFENIQTSFGELSCEKHPLFIAKQLYTPCSQSGSRGEIGYLSHNDFHRLIDFCHDERLGHTLYAHANILATIDSRQSSIQRPYFIKDGFFQGISIQKAYQKKNQIQVFQQILGSNRLAAKYIGKGNNYLARGHLIAKADFIYGSQQRATFHYVNCAPMWQNINAGNWKQIEIGVRQFASSRNRNLDVWTGTHGVLRLEDVNGTMQEIFLYSHGRIPVPEFLFKVVFDKKDGAGVVFITVNYPRLRVLSKEYLICENVSNQIKYVPWDINNSYEGYSYACEIDDFRKSFSYLPRFKTNRLLT